VFQTLPELLTERGTRAAAPGARQSCGHAPAHAGAAGVPGMAWRQDQQRQGPASRPLASARTCLASCCRPPRAAAVAMPQLQQGEVGMLGAEGSGRAEDAVSGARSCLIEQAKPGRSTKGRKCIKRVQTGGGPGARAWWCGVRVRPSCGPAAHAAMRRRLPFPTPPEDVSPRGSGLHRLLTSPSQVCCLHHQARRRSQGHSTGAERPSFQGRRHASIQAESLRRLRWVHIPRPQRLA